MKSILKLMVTFLVLGISPAFAQSVDEPEATPFHISSRGSAYGVQGEFEGTYQVTDSSIEVYVSKATLYVSEHCPYQGRRRINYITLGLWNQEASNSRIANRTQPLYLYVVMSPREEHLMFDLRFSLPLESTVDLAKRWLVVEIQEDTLDGPAQSGKGYAFVHSCPDIFVKKRSPETVQKTACKR
ncbi:MAG: hypothetical protein ND895_16890 [Pyrinomonadaceae bacterium]|nr:hypothetical protein [Pyrinomonadaceae bacterium]